LALPVPGVEKSQDEGMKQGKTRLFCVGENLLSVEVVLVALFWVSEPVTETLALDKGNLLRMLLPEQAWDRGLLAIVVLVFACYVRRGLRAEGPPRGAPEDRGEVLFYGRHHRVLRQLIRGRNESIQSAYGCAVGSLLLLAISDDIPALFKAVWRGDPKNGSETVWGKREGRRSYVRTAVSPIRA
jgi:hypothetical protein